jgi:F-type H+-transporting ATPase subunit delta
MADPTTVARPYAEAVFKLAQQSGSLDQWSQTLGGLAAVASHPQMAGLIADPKLSDTQRVETMLGVFSASGGTATAEVRSLVQLLAHNDRLALLPEIRARFEQYKNDAQGVVDATIETAFPLDAGQQQALVADLERRFQRRVNPRISVQPELIGGVKIVVGDTVIDASVRGKLAGMSAALLKV